MIEELKACPFCGGEAYLNPQNGDPEDSHEVCCSNCGGYAWGESLDRAVKNWNRRATMTEIDHPAHYQGGIEVIDFVESHNLNFNLGNVVKYITRAGKKSGEGIITALLKAQWYLGREIIRAGHELERRQY